MKEEIFKEIAGYEGLYEVSNLGNVRRVAGKGCKETRVLKPWKTKDGYMSVNLCKDGNRKDYLVHRLVAQAFIPNPDNLPEVNHIDENKENNQVNNLEWCDHKQNCNHGTRNQRSAEVRINDSKQSDIVLQMTLDYTLVKEWSSVRECGRNGFSISVVSRCCNNKYGKQGNVYKGYRWMFAKDYYTLLARQNKDIPSSLSENHDARV